MGDRCVAVIDGDPAVRDSLATLMELNGHEVATYSTARAFLRAVDGKPVDCIICEAELPDSSGVDLYRTVAQILPDTRFALLVSSQEARTASTAKRAGIRDIFSKPLVHRKLVRFVSGS
jgi:two-component system response regulator FixJ